MTEQAGARSSSPGGAATSPETPRTSGPAAVVGPRGLHGPGYLTIELATRWSVFWPLPPARQSPPGPTDLEGTGATGDIPRCAEAAALAAVTGAPGGTGPRGRDGPSGASRRCARVRGRGPRARARKKIAGARPREEGAGRGGGSEEAGTGAGRRGPVRFEWFGEDELLDPEEGGWGRGRGAGKRKLSYKTSQSPSFPRQANDTAAPELSARTEI